MRMKYPCRHIIALFGDVHLEMYSVRWLIEYAHFFERKGNDVQFVFDLKCIC